MNTMKNQIEKISENKVISWDKHLDKKYGTNGSISRTKFETKAQTFILNELLKEAIYQG